MGALQRGHDSLSRSFSTLRISLGASTIGPLALASFLISMKRVLVRAAIARAKAAISSFLQFLAVVVGPTQRWIPRRNLVSPPRSQDLLAVTR